MIRMATEQDLPEMLAIYRPFVESTACSFEYTTPTLSQFTQRFREITAQFPWLVWEEEGRVSGYCYACLPFARAAYRWCAEPSIYLAPEARGRGIGRRLYEALEDILGKQGYQLLYAIITDQNTPSIAFHQHLGYRELAHFPGCAYKFGRNLGILWMEKRLSPVETPSIFPKSWREVVETDKI